MANEKDMKQDEMKNHDFESSNKMKKSMKSLLNKN